MFENKHLLWPANVTCVVRRNLPPEPRAEWAAAAATSTTVSLPHHPYVSIYMSYFYYQRYSIRCYYFFIFFCSFFFSITWWVWGAGIHPKKKTGEDCVAILWFTQMASPSLEVAKEMSSEQDSLRVSSGGSFQLVKIIPVCTGKSDGWLHGRCTHKNI